MKARQFLNQLKKLNIMIENKLVEKAQWQCMAKSTTAQMSGERVQSTSNPQKMESAIIRYLDLERDIDSFIDQLVDARKDIISVIEQLNATEYDILHKIYVGVADPKDKDNPIHYMTIDEVARVYDKSYSWVTSVHGRALKHVQDILNERESLKKCEKV